MGVPFTVYTDHCTLENFNRQKNLTCRPLCWQEFLGQYDFVIKYIKGEDNVVADALSRVELIDLVTCAMVAAIRDVTRVVCNRPNPSPPVSSSQMGSLHMATDPAWLDSIRNGYLSDAWCRRLRKNVGSLGITECDGLLFVSDQ